MAKSLLDFYGQPEAQQQRNRPTTTGQRSLLDAYQPLPPGRVPETPPPQAPAPNQDAGLWPDTANLAKMGIGQLGQGAGYLTGIESLEKAGAGLAERSMQALSPAQQQAMQNEFVTHSDEEGYGVGPALTETPFRSLYGALVSSLPATAAGMGVGGVATKGLAAAGSAMAARSGAAAGNLLAKPGINAAGQAVMRPTAVSGAVGFGAGEGLVSAGIAGSDVKDFVRTADQELLDQAPGYQELIAQGLDPATARETLAEELAGNAALGSGAIVGLLGAPMGAVFGRWMGGVGPQTMRGAVLGGAAGEAAQEAGQSAGEEYVGGTQRARIDPTEAPTLASMANQAVGGALAGGAMGAGFGGFQGYAQQKRNALLDVAGVPAGRLPETAAEPVEQRSLASPQRRAMDRAGQVTFPDGSTTSDPAVVDAYVADRVAQYPQDQQAEVERNLRARLYQGKAKPPPGERGTEAVPGSTQRLIGNVDRPGVPVGEPTVPERKRQQAEKRPTERLEQQAQRLLTVDREKGLTDSARETLDAVASVLLERPDADPQVRALVAQYGQPSAPAAGSPPSDRPSLVEAYQAASGRETTAQPDQPSPGRPDDISPRSQPSDPRQDRPDQPEAALAPRTTQRTPEASATPQLPPDQAGQALAGQNRRPEPTTDQRPVSAQSEPSSRTPAPSAAELRPDTADTNRPSQPPAGEDADSVAQDVHERPIYRGTRTGGRKMESARINAALTGKGLRKGEEFWTPDRNMASAYSGEGETDAQGEIQEAKLAPDAKVLTLVRPDGSVDPQGMAFYNRAAGTNFATEDGFFNHVMGSGISEIGDAVRAEGFDAVESMDLDGPELMVLNPAKVVRGQPTEAFTPTHEAPDGTPLRATAEPDVYEDAEGVEIEEANATPITRPRAPTDEETQQAETAPVLTGTELAERYNVTAQSSEDKARSYGRGRYGKEPFTVVERDGRFYAVPEGAQPVHTDTEGDTEPATSATEAKSAQTQDAIPESAEIETGRTYTESGTKKRNVTTRVDDERISLQLQSAHGRSGYNVVTENGEVLANNLPMKDATTLATNLIRSAKRSANDWYVASGNDVYPLSKQHSFDKTPVSEKLKAIKARIATSGDAAFSETNRALERKAIVGPKDHKPGKVTASQVNAGGKTNKDWWTGTVKGKTFWTQGNIVIGKPPFGIQNKPVEPGTRAEKQASYAKEIDRVIPRYGEQDKATVKAYVSPAMEVDPANSYTNGVLEQDRGIVVLESEPAGRVALDKRYVDLFHKQYRGKTLTFYVPNNQSAVVVEADGELVGVIANMRTQGMEARLDAIDQIVAEQGGAVPKTKTRESAPQPKATKAEAVPAAKPEPEARPTPQAQRLRKVAESLAEKAQGTLDQPRQTNTNRRASMASGIEANARADLAMAETIRNLADAIDAGQAPALAKINSKAAVETLDGLLRQAKYANDRKAGKDTKRSADASDIPFATLPTMEWSDHVANKAKVIAALKGKKGGPDLATRIRRASRPTVEIVNDTRKMVGVDKARDVLGWMNLEDAAKIERLARVGIKSDKDLRQALTEYLDHRAGTKKADPIQVAERALVGRKVGVDFFPTPKPLAARMAELAGIEKGMRVLEPSAGNGHLADAARDAGATVDTVEISDALRDVLEAKGHNIVARDFTEFTPAAPYDAILMNPPFSDRRDAVHIQRAYDQLAPGGTLVAIAGEGVFFGTDKKAQAFRGWLDENDAQVEKLPANTFKGADLPAQTGTNARLITLRKGDAETRYSRATLTNDDVNAFARQLEDDLGLQALVLTYSQRTGDLKLNSLIVPEGQRKTGKGTQAMDAITAFADRHGKRITLSPGLPDDRHGTTSRARLVRYYKRFGFIENKGRNKDFSISDGMYREPRSEDIRFARGQQSRNTAAAVRTELSLNRRAERALLDSGLVTIVQSASDIPGKHPSDVAGAYHQGKVYLVADNIPAGRAEGLLLHEIVHAELKNSVGDKEFQAILADVRRNALRGLPKFAQARRSVPLDTPAAHFDEENLSYLIQDNPSLPIVRRFMAWLRGKLRRLGLIRGYTADDLTREAGLALTRLVANLDTVQSDTLFSRAPPTDTAAFTAWFSGSKLTDPDGSPRVFYHVPSADFTAFDKATQQRPGAGFFFSTTPDNANRLAGRRPEGANVMPVYLKADNPLNPAELSKQDEATLRKAYRRDYRATKLPKRADYPSDAMYERAKDTFDARWKTIDSLTDGFISKVKGGQYGFMENTDTQRVIQDAGFDAYFVKEGDFTNVAVYEPTQIKSVFNAGSFSPSDADIRYARNEDALDAIQAASVPQYSRDAIADELVSPDGIEQRNEADPDRMAVLADRMRKAGWEGRPLLILQPEGQSQYALTGSNRLEAARDAGLDEVPVVYVDNEKFEAFAAEYDWVTLERFAHRTDEDEQVKLLREMGDARAADLMQAEIDAWVPDATMYSRRPADTTDRAALSRSLLTRNRGDVAAAQREAKALYPGMAEDIGDWIETNKDRWQEAGDDVGTMYSRADQYDTPEQEAAMAKIDPESPSMWTRRKLTEALENWQYKLRQGTIDQFDKLLRNDQAVYGKDVVEKNTGLAAWVLARQSKSAEGALQAMIYHGRPFMDNGAINVDENEKSLLETFEPLQGEVKRFLGWIAGNRAERLRMEPLDEIVRVLRSGQNIDGIRRDLAALNLNDIVRELDNRTPESLARQLNGYRSSGLEGAMQAMQAAGFKNSVTYLKNATRERLFDDTEIKALKTLNQGTLPDGQDRDAVYRSVQRDFRQLQKAVLDIVEGAGLINAQDRAIWEHDFYVPFFRVIEDDSGDIQARGLSVSSGLVKQKAFERLKGGEEGLNNLLTNTLMNWNHLLGASLRNQAADRALDTAQKLGIATKLKAAGKGSVYVMRDGQPVHYQVDDPLTLEAITALDWQGMRNPAMRLIRGAKRLFTRVVTISPAFQIANLMRDSIHSIAVTKLGANPMANVARGWKQFDINRGKMLAGGGAFQFGARLEGDSKAIQRHLEKQVKGNVLLADTPNKAWKGLQDALQAWDNFSNRTENVNRAALYQQLRDQGHDHLYASFQARDLMDFSQTGAWASTRFLTMAVPFLNARLQGLDKLGRAGLDPKQRVKFALTIGAVMAASSLLYLINSDDERFRELEEWQRDSYWWFFAGDLVLAIPKPFEVGAMGTLAERALEQAVDAGADGTLFLQRLKHVLLETFSFNPTPQIVAPLLDLYANRDPFRDRPIESMSLQNMSPTQRATVGTSEFAKGVSWLLNPALETATNSSLSPVQVDYLVAGYFGWIGQQALKVSDLAAKPAVGLPSAHRDWLYDTPLTGDLARRFLPDLDRNAYTKSLTAFYEDLRKKEQLWADFRTHREQGDVNAARGILEQEPGLQLWLTHARRVQRRLSDIRKQTNRVQRDGRLSAAERERRLRVLNQQRKDTARAFMSVQG